MKEYTVKVFEDGTKCWYLDGKRHREDGPAVEFSSGTRAWYLDGKFHREDGPAIDYGNGDKEWYLDGQLHREDGPAIERADGSKAWYLHGNHLTEEEHKRRTSGITMDDALKAGDGVILREQAARIKELEARVEELEQSESRYLWIRDGGWMLIGKDRGGGPEWPEAAEVDRLVDAAIAKAKGE